MDEIKKIERTIGGKTLSIETGHLARQAEGSVLVRYEDTVVLVTAVTGDPREGIDFFPLTVEYREMRYAAGRIPGGFFKREGRPSTKETLTMRMIDRPIRPLFPEGYKREVQIIATVLSADQENDPDILALLGASCALGMSSAPFLGSIGGVRVGYIDGEFVINPTVSQLEESELDMVCAGTAEDMVMIEVGANEFSEDKIMAAIEFGRHTIAEVIEMQDELISACGTEHPPFEAVSHKELEDKLAETYADELRELKVVSEKGRRETGCLDLKERVLQEVATTDEAGAEAAGEPVYSEAEVKAAWRKVEKGVIRQLICAGTRPDGREADQLREITCDVGIMPRTHGSAVFTRGETQAMAIATLGTTQDEQRVDGLLDEFKKKFMLHYNFPPFSTGEVRPIRGPRRREIGHGALAERSLAPVLPPVEKFPYTIRIVAEILESNGSSSMASVCGATLALMDAGVPISNPVAGISIGLVKEGDKTILLTDIIGEEDHCGDMDCKVAGTQVGITAIQMDMKVKGLSLDLIRDALERARQARMEILKSMLTAIAAPRGEISEHAPRLLHIKIDPEKIGKVIGPGGKTIRKIQEETGALIEIEDDGTVLISSVKGGDAEAAREIVEQMTAKVEVGKIYEGTVVNVRDFGAFIEILPGQDGMCHISELADGYVEKVADVVKVGDKVKAKVIAVDDQGRVKLSLRAAAKAEAKSE
ncbi:MAG: polyribonucleotide nucleotidyltransferase [Planctomycetia bacterium]|nr:polyribonucleotide nucleotidyltransferase [Planctomycetia bacterium]